MLGVAARVDSKEVMRDEIKLNLQGYKLSMKNGLHP
jgi:hypothetical protein